ncbi:MAG: S-adenosylmethionine:tRNA ribosyltransferase-isomerase [Bacteroidales bacterium]|nr:S-adenosylmethionine:tRNA ribosyltransferase-isomerase [Bacteroidales bacterium]
MNNPRDIAIADYDYPLPDNRIAKYPLEQRDHSKLLVYRNGEITESQFFHLPELLPEESLLVFNDTKVIHARLFFQKSTGSTIEIFCLEPYKMAISQAFEQRKQCTWTCYIGNNKKWKKGALTRTIEIDGQTITLYANRLEAIGDAWIVEFSWDGGASFAEVIDQAGVIPLPPYLHREAVNSDNERYQTVYARYEGSVAAPTAGLHFTQEVFNGLQKRHITTDFITLHVGAGTFKPVSTETIGKHEMHVEKIEIVRQNIESLLRQLSSPSHRPIISVGTTSVRTIESVYWFGVKLSQNPDLNSMHILQWDPYELENLHINTVEAYHNVIQWMEQQGLDHLVGDTQLMIAPGYKYHVINGLITNFHQPKSTLLLLVSALIGDAWHRCYSYALDHNFRFLSYGDSCLFLT